MTLKTRLFLLLIFNFFFITRAQKNPYVDSLLLALKTQKNDTNKVNTLNELAWEFGIIDLKKARNYCNSSIKLAGKLNFFKGRSSAYNTLGNISSDEVKNDEALKYYLLSIKDKEKVKDEKGIATVYNNIGIIYQIMSDYDKALQYYKLSLRQRKSLKDKKGIADCHNNIGNVYRKQSLYISALSNFYEAKEIRMQIGDKIGIASSLNNIATVYSDQADFINALKYYIESAKILEKENDLNSLSRVYNNISGINQKLRNYKEAIKYSTLALKFSEEIGNKNFSINSYDNLGNTYFELKNYKEALLNFDKGMILAKQSKNKEMESQFYAGLGLCYEKSNNLNKAESSYKKAIEIVKETGEIKKVVTFTNILATLYVKSKQNTQAEALLNYSILTSKKNGLKYDLKNAYKIYADYYQSNLNNLIKSNQYYKLYSDLNESLFSEDVAQKFAEQQTRYESEKQQSEIKSLKQQKTINSLLLKKQELTLQKRMYLLIGSLIFILSLFLIGYLYFSKQKIKNKQKQDQLIRETEENERSRMAKDIHDDLGSGLSKISILSGIIFNNAQENHELRSGIQSISETAVSLVENMRDLIWVLDTENSSLESLIARIREYGSEYLNDFPIEITFEITELIPERKITNEAQRNIFFIIKESLQNIVKHSKASKVLIKIDITENDFDLIVSDNGKGFKTENQKNGNGLSNINQRSLALGGKAVFNSESNGLKIHFSVSIKNIVNS